jgi:hypothetical protein
LKKKKNQVQFIIPECNVQRTAGIVGGMEQFEYRTASSLAYKATLSATCPLCEATGDMIQI